ncbi:hypothetical protein QTP88_010548 [Uroleucon formosanum]
MSFVILYRVCSQNNFGYVSYIFLKSFTSVALSFRFALHVVFGAGSLKPCDGPACCFFLSSCCFDIDLRVFNCPFLSAVKKPRCLLGWSLLLPAIIVSRGFRIRPFLIYLVGSAALCANYLPAPSAATNTQELYILHRLFEKLNNKADFEISKEFPSVVSENVEFNSDNVQTSSAEEENKVLDAPAPQICYNDTIIFETSSVINKNILNYQTTAAVVKKLKVSPLQECLVWPVTPERKGNRRTERLPFVISSQMWQNMHEHKEDIKNN